MGPITNSLRRLHLETLMLSKISIYADYSIIALQLCTITKGFDARRSIENRVHLFTITLPFPPLTITTLTSSWRMEYCIASNGSGYGKGQIKKNQLYTTSSIHLFGRLQKRIRQPWFNLALHDCPPSLEGMHL